MSRIITFTGAQGTGKTTMKEALAKYLIDRGYYVLTQYPGVGDSISRDAAASGFPINENTEFMSQYYIALQYCKHDLMLRQYMKTTHFDFAILDRSVLDTIPYTMVAPCIDSDKKILIQDMMVKHFDLFSSELVYCKPLDIGIVDDKIRSIDRAFQLLIDGEFSRQLDHMFEPDEYHVLNSMSVDERLSHLIEVLDL